MCLGVLVGMGGMSLSLSAWRGCEREREDERCRSDPKLPRRRYSPFTSSDLSLTPCADREDTEIAP